MKAFSLEKYRHFVNHKVIKMKVKSQKKNNKLVNNKSFFTKSIEIKGPQKLHKSFCSKSTGVYKLKII